MSERASAAVVLPAPRVRTRPLTDRVGRALGYLGLALVGLTTVAPFLWMISTSLKLPGQVFIFPPELIPDPVVWTNYATVWQVVPFGSFFVNTLFVATTVTVLHVVTCTSAGYAFARLRFPGRDRLFFMYLGTMMIPGQVTLIPAFVLMKYLGWIDTYLALIIPPIFGAFGTFLLRQFFLSIPVELEDAARIDGSGYLGLVLRIILPLSGPAVATLAIFTFMAQWNSFLWPLIVTNSPSMMVISVGLRFFQGSYYTDWPKLMAAASMALVPVLIVFVLGQKYFVRGITLTGITGR